MLNPAFRDILYAFDAEGVEHLVAYAMGVVPRQDVVRAAYAVGGVAIRPAPERAQRETRSEDRSSAACVHSGADPALIRRSRSATVAITSSNGGTSPKIIPAIAS